MTATAGDPFAVQRLLGHEHIGSPTVPMRAESTPSGTRIGLFDDYSGIYIQLSNQTTLYSGSWSAKTYSSGNTIQAKPIFVKGKRVVAVDQNEELALVAFRSADTLNGFPNNIISALLQASFSTGSVGTYNINFYKNPIGAISGGTWETIRLGISPLELNTAIVFTPDIADKPIYSESLLTEGVASRDSERIETDFYHFP